MSDHDQARVLILVVEDDPNDAELLRIAIDEAGINASVDVVTDGTSALQYLRRQDNYTAALRPSLVLLDLNLPGIHGHQVLDEIKSDPSLKTIPVVVMSTSLDDHDIDTSYRHHANAYLTKPPSFDAMVLTMTAVRDFWFTTARLPRH